MGQTKKLAEKGSSQVGQRIKKIERRQKNIFNAYEYTTITVIILYL